MTVSNNGSVLIVEDEWLLRRELADVFADAGWRVDEAINAQEAITALEEGTYCVVVTDIRMGPGLSGWDVGRACAAKGTPVIFVSGNLYDASEAVPDSLFFAKPCEAAEIVSACDRWRGGQLKEHEADNSQ